MVTLSLDAPADRDLPDPGGVGVSAGSSIRARLALLSLGAGVLHFVAAPEHLGEHRTLGLAFLATAWLQLLWAWLLVRRPSMAVLALGAGGQLTAALTWVVVHTRGWPAGPLRGTVEEPTAVGVAAVALEAAAVLLSVLAVRAHRVGVSRRVAATLRPAVAVAAAAVVLGSSTAVAVSGGGGAEHGHDAVPEVAAAPVAGATSAPAHGHPVDTTPPTAAQRAAADRLLTSTRAALVPRFSLLADAEAAGYRVIHDAGGRLLHYGHPGYMADDRVLDPQRVESLVYVVLPNGGSLLVGGMYMAPRGEPGPRIGGSLTQWHNHTDLCLDGARGLAITPNADGSCPPGSAVGTTGEMLHVWTVDYPNGPFAELDAEALRTAVLRHFGATT